MTPVILFCYNNSMNYQKYLDNKVKSLKGVRILITGANSGIGFSFAKQASYKGASIVMACRNEERANKAIKAIKEEVEEADLSFIKYDQSSFESIRNFVSLIEKEKFDVVALNAGIFKPGCDLKTADGFPLTTGTNYMGMFYLLKLLEKKIKNKDIKKIIIVSSFGRWFAPRNYLSYLKDDKNKLWKSYFSSKRMNFEIAGNLKYKYPELVVSIVHPGIAVTRIVNNELGRFPRLISKFGEVLMRTFSNTSDKSALCFLKDLTDPEAKDINYVYPRGLIHTSGYPSKKILKANKIKSDLLEATSNSLIKD